MTIELLPEIEIALATQANQCGLTPEQLANELLLDKLREMNGDGQAPVNGVDSGDDGPKDELAEGTLADLLAGRIGTVNGSDEALSLNCGERFADYVVQKHREGKL
ncbi:MAG: hypothetical protein ACREBD_34125 [Blastocatellia bacterium]